MAFRRLGALMHGAGLRLAVGRARLAMAGGSGLGMCRRGVGVVDRRHWPNSPGGGSYDKSRLTSTRLAESSFRASSVRAVCEEYSVDYLIETNFQGPGFVAVPNHVVDDERLSPDALGVLVWLARRPVGFIARTVSIRERFGIGKDRWQRIARELRAAGAIQRVPVRLASGAFSGWRYEVRWPEPAAAVDEVLTISRETRPMDHKPGNPAAGKPAKGCRKTRQRVPENPAPYKDKELDKGPAALPLDLKEVGRIARAEILAGRSAFVGGVVLKPGSPQFVALSDLLRNGVGCVGAG